MLFRSDVRRYLAHEDGRDRFRDRPCGRDGRYAVIVHDSKGFLRLIQRATERDHRDDVREPHLIADLLHRVLVGVERLALLLALALLISIAPQAGAAAIVYRAKVAATDVFSGFGTPTPSGSATDSTTPTPTPPPLGDRFTMLLIGADTMGNRTSFNTDSMIIVSWDRVGGYVSTVSIPRDLVNVPLGNGDVFGPKINSLWSYALRYPKKFPDGPAAALSTALGTMFDVKIDAKIGRAHV